MNRRRWVIAVLAAWALSLGWLVKREVFRPTGARLAAAAMAVAPGGLFYRLAVGGQQIGCSSTTIDTLPDAIRVENVFVLDVPALGTLHRTTARSITTLSRALRLQTVAATFDGDLGQFAAHGRVLGDTVLSIAIVSEGDSQMTRIPLQGPITLPTLLPLRLAFGGELRSGRSYTARLFDPLLLTGRDVTARVAAESTLVVSESADLDSTTMTWVPDHFDTVRAGNPVERASATKSVAASLQSPRAVSSTFSALVTLPACGMMRCSVRWTQCVSSSATRAGLRSRSMTRRAWAAIRGL